MTTVKTTFPYPEVYEGGAGETLVLIHGFTETWRVWIPILKLLEPHYRVIAPTIPGHVGGLPLDGPANPLTIAAVLARQLRDRGITHAHFVGQSLGGWQAYEMVRHGLARSALGLSPGGAYLSEQVKIDFLRKSRSLLKAFPYAAPVILLLARFSWLRKKILAGEMTHGDRVPYEVVQDRLSRMRQMMPVLKEFLDLELQPMKPLPADSKVPLGVVWCEKDTTLPFDGFGQPLLDVLRLKSYGVLKGCGHNPMYDDPEGVVKAILDFTRSVERQRP